MSGITLESLMKAGQALDAQPIREPLALYMTKAQCARVYGQHRADEVWRDVPNDQDLIFWEDGRITSW